MKQKLIVLAGVFTCIAIIVSSCQSEDEQMFNRYYASGSILYKAHCENCHGTNGEGLGALIPPLHDSAYMKKNIGKLACFVRNGISDTITVAGKSYNNKMPAQDNLSAIAVAEILTYVTNSFGNKTGIIDAPAVNASWKDCN